MLLTTGQGKVCLSESGSWPRSSLASVGDKQPPGERERSSIFPVNTGSAAGGQLELTPALEIIRVMIIMMMIVMMTLISVMEAVTAQGSSIVAGSKLLSCGKTKGCS